MGGRGRGRKTTFPIIGFKKSEFIHGKEEKFVPLLLATRRSRYLQARGFFLLDWR